MNKITYFFLLSLSILISAEKVYFFIQEPKYHSSLLGIAELSLMVGLLFWSLYSFLKTPPTVVKTSDSKSRSKPAAKKVIAILVGAGLFLGLSSFWHNYTKIALDWDAVALYDARAQFLRGGVKFSEMGSIAKYDYKNGYYYLLYPPFTSFTHYLWYQVGIPLPISLLYTFFLMGMGIGIFLLLQPRLGTTWSLVATLLVLGQQSLFSTSLVAYTNLPYTLYLSLGILTLHRYLIEKKIWWFCLGVVLVSSSQWIRFLEPSWLAVVLAFFLVGVSKDWRSYSFKSLIMAFYCLLGYVSWKYFTDVISDKEAIFNTSPLYILEPVIGIFTGAFLQMALIYTRMWGSIILIYLGSFLSLLLQLKKPEIKADTFLFLVIFFSFAMYFCGLYFISFQFDWWPEMAGSLLRSSTFLLAPAIYLVVKAVKDVFEQ